MRVKIDAIQNTIAAPNIRKVVSEIAFINPLDKTILEEGDMHPHNTFAISIAKCPL